MKKIPYNDNEKSNDNISMSVELYYNARNSENDPCDCSYDYSKTYILSNLHTIYNGSTGGVFNL